MLYNIITKTDGWVSGKSLDGKQINLSILRGKCPTGRENITFPVLAFLIQATQIVWRTTFFLFFRIFMPGQPMTLFLQGAQRRIYFITRPRRQISGIESLFSIRTPVPSNHLCSLVPSKLILTISICDSLSAMPRPLSPFSIPVCGGRQRDTRRP